MKQDIPKPTIETPKRVKTREAVLAIGARLVNEYGAGSIRLSQIADELDLSRNSLYYYAEDRVSLIYKCYTKSCDFIEQSIGSALSIEGPQDVKIRTLISALLDRSGDEYAIISDLKLLKEADRLNIETRLNRHVKSVADIVERGQKGRLFGEFDPRIIAQMIIGMVDWTILWNQWTSDDHKMRLRRNKTAANAISDLLLFGLSPTSHEQFNCQIEAVSLTRSEYNLFDREDANEQRREILLGAAAKLFNEHGIHAVSIDDIAASVGATKGAIYHHFKDKSALILACHSRAFDHYEAFNNAAISIENKPLRQMLTVFNLNCQAQAGPKPPLVFYPGLHTLPENFLERARVMATQMRTVHSAGLSKKSIRNTNPTIVELSAGAFMRLAKWRDQLSDISAQKLADTMTNVLLSGLIAEPK